MILVGEIVRLQVKLRMVEEASRYSVLLAERKRDLPAEFLVEVANFCIKQGEPLRGAQLLERAISLRQAENASTDVLGLRLRLLQILASEEQTQEAAEQASFVFELLTDPQKHNLDLSAIESAASSWRQTYLELARVHLAADQVVGQQGARHAREPGPPDQHAQEALRCPRELGGVEVFQGDRLLAGEEVARRLHFARPVEVAGWPLEHGQILVRQARDLPERVRSGPVASPFPQGDLRLTSGRPQVLGQIPLGHSQPFPDLADDPADLYSRPPDRHPIGRMEASA
jgi:hypothetical protein